MNNLHFTKSSVYKINMNEYIENMTECAQFIFDIDNDMNIEEVIIYNDGAKPSLIKRLAKYLENLDLNVYVFNRPMV
jgi:hypothetical protein